MDPFKRTTWNFFSGNQLTFGPGAVGALTGVVHRRQAERVLVVGDPKLAGAGILSHVETALELAGCSWETFGDGEVEPSASTVARVLDVARELEPDLVVAVGGGSNMDLAKGAAAAYSHQVDVETLFGFDMLPGPTLPLVCIPTTAGTGSEVSHVAVIKKAKTGKKAAITSQHVRPDVAIVDPQLTLSCPAKVTAESGIDALSHAIEAYLVTNFYAFSEDLENGLPHEGNHPLGDLYAENAISLIGKNLATVVEDPHQLAARSAMSYAATLAGAAFSSCGLSLVHALEYPIGGKYGCSHGIGNGIVLPAVLEFWLPQRTKRLAKIAELFSVPDAERMPPDEAAHAAIEFIKTLRATIGLPTGLSQVGAQDDDIPELAKTTIWLQRLIDLSPRKPSPDDVRAMLAASM